MISDFGLFTRIDAADCTWSIALPNDTRLLRAPDLLNRFQPNFIDRVQGAPDKPHAVAIFHANPDHISFIIILPEVLFSQVRQLLDLAICSDSIEFTIALDFLGFPSISTPLPDLPSAQEFIDEKPLFFDDVTFSIGVRREKDNK